MSETLHDLVVSLSLSTDNFKRNHQDRKSTDRRSREQARSCRSRWLREIGQCSGLADRCAEKRTIHNVARGL